MHETALDRRRAGALAALGQLAILIDVLEGLGPVATRAVRAKLRKTTKK